MELVFPDFPPTGPWQAYVWYIAFLPFLFRLLLVSRPLYQVIKVLAPHGGWAIKQIRELPIKGIRLLAFNQILAFCLPPFLVLLIRLLVDPLGWQSWSDVNATGLALLLAAFMIWVYLDLLRVFRVRMMMQAVLEQDIGKLRKRAGIFLGARSWLKKIGRGEEESEKPLIWSSCRGIGWPVCPLARRRNHSSEAAFRDHCGTHGPAITMPEDSYRLYQFALNRSKK